MPGGVLVLQPGRPARLLAIQEGALELGFPHLQPRSTREPAFTGLLGALPLDSQGFGEPGALSRDEPRPQAADCLRGSRTPASQVVLEVRTGEQTAALRAPHARQSLP